MNLILCISTPSLLPLYTMALELLPLPPLCTNVLCTVVFHLPNETPYLPTIITNGKLLPLLPLCKNLQFNKSFGPPIVVCHSWNGMSYLNQRLLNKNGSLLIHHFVAFLLPFCNFLLQDTVCIILGWKWRKLQKGYKELCRCNITRKHGIFLLCFFTTFFCLRCYVHAFVSQALVYTWNLNLCTILMDYGIFVGWSCKFQKLLRLHHKTKGLYDAMSSFPMILGLHLWTRGTSMKKGNKCNLLPILNFQKHLSLMEMKMQMRYPFGGGLEDENVDINYVTKQKKEWQ